MLAAELAKTCEYTNRSSKAASTRGIHARYVFPHQAFKPTLRLPAVEGMPHFGRQGVAEPRQVRVRNFRKGSAPGPRKS